MAVPTLTSMRNVIKALVYQGSINKTYSDTAIDNALNMAYRRIISDIRGIDPMAYVKQATTYMSTVADQELYPLPADLETLIQLEYLVQGAWQKMTQIAFEDKWDYQKSFVNNIWNYDPPYVYYLVWVAAQNSADQHHNIGLLPIPTSSASNVMRPIYYYQMDVLAAAEYVHLPDRGYPGPDRTLRSGGSCRRDTVIRRPQRAGGERHFGFIASL